MSEKIMINITDKLSEFRETQDVSILGISYEDINFEEYNVIAVEILAWLKLEYKRVL